jgi:thiamine pyrophosphate-dependent acetolactate synthase large subunit-like protein
MTGGDAIVDSMLRHGIDTIFGLPAVQIYGLFDASIGVEKKQPNFSSLNKGASMAGEGATGVRRGLARLCNR